MGKKSLTIRLSTQTREWVDIESKRHSKSRSYILDKLVKDFIRGSW